jgi:hypothetical protein
VTSRRPNKASLFAFGNDSEQPRVSSRLFRTNYSDAEWNVRVGPDGKIEPRVNPKDPRHRNSFNEDLYARRAPMRILDIFGPRILFSGHSMRRA